jgi:oxygen-independent coproporphyrinogen-3 oxidase
MDIIAGLPDETVDMFENTLEEIEKLDPDSLTVHTLSIKRAANLKEDAEKQKLLNADMVGTMIDKAENFASGLNMHPYYMYRQKNILGNHENVAYCKKGCESPYNIHIMEEDQTIMAVGI